MSIIFRRDYLHCSSNICKFFFIIHPVTCKTVSLGEVVIIFCHRQVEAVLFLLVQTGKQTVKDVIIALIWHLTGGRKSHTSSNWFVYSREQIPPHPPLFFTHHQCKGLGNFPWNNSYLEKSTKLSESLRCLLMNVSRALKQIYLGGYRLRAYIIFRNRNMY